MLEWNADGAAVTGTTPDESTRRTTSADAATESGRHEERGNSRDRVLHGIGLEGQRRAVADHRQAVPVTQSAAVPQRVMPTEDGRRFHAPRTSRAAQAADVPRASRRALAPVFVHGDHSAPRPEAAASAAPTAGVEDTVGPDHRDQRLNVAATTSVHHARRRGDTPLQPATLPAKRLAAGPTSPDAVEFPHAIRDPWHSLSGEPARVHEHGDLSSARRVPGKLHAPAFSDVTTAGVVPETGAGPWPELPPLDQGAAARHHFTTAWHAWERRERLDREQRGETWNAWRS